MAVYAPPPRLRLSRGTERGHVHSTRCGANLVGRGQKSTCITQLTLGPYVVKIRSRNTRICGGERGLDWLRSSRVFLHAFRVRVPDLEGGFLDASAPLPPELQVNKFRMIFCKQISKIH